MAVLPRLEMRLVRGSAGGGELGVMMRTTAVEVPPYLLAPVMFASWMWLAPLVALSAAQGGGRAPADRAAPLPPTAPGRARPEPNAAAGAGNVISFPSRARPR